MQWSTTIEPATATEEPVKIVMVDDDPSEHVLMLAAAKEVDVPSDFTFFDDGADALLHLQRTGVDDLPDVIVLDLRMPGLDGHSTLDELQADPVLWQVPVVVFTSSPRRSDADTAIDRGAVSYVVKPSDFDTMVSNVSDLCDLARSGMTPDVVDAEASGRADRRATIEQLSDIVDDYLGQLFVEAAQPTQRTNLAAEAIADAAKAEGATLAERIHAALGTPMDTVQSNEAQTEETPQDGAI